MHQQLIECFFQIINYYENVRFRNIRKPEQCITLQKQ